MKTASLREIIDLSKQGLAPVENISVSDFQRLGVAVYIGLTRDFSNTPRQATYYSLNRMPVKFSDKSVHNTLGLRG